MRVVALRANDNEAKYMNFSQVSCSQLSHSKQHLLAIAKYIHFMKNASVFSLRSTVGNEWLTDITTRRHRYDTEHVMLTTKGKHRHFNLTLRWICATFQDLCWSRHVGNSDHEPCRELRFKMSSLCLRCQHHMLGVWNYAAAHVLSCRHAFQHDVGGLKTKIFHKMNIFS